MTEAWLYEYYREKIMRFYGREEELQVLKNFLLTVQKKKISQMVTVIGRRRVGKTTLILKAFEKAEIPVFYFFVERQSSKEEIIASWLDMICRAYHIEFPPALNTIADVISYLMSLSEKQECVCIIDECQEFNAVSPQTWSQLQKVWDLKKNEVKLNTRKYSEAKLKLSAEAFLEDNPKLKEYKLSIKGLSLENV